MVKFLPAGAEFPRTDKGTVIRVAFHRVFKAQIKGIYADLKRGTSNDGLELP